jgi:uncharacterized membrane protein YdjX (TVP38/TMEM64 family)
MSSGDVSGVRGKRRIILALLVLALLAVLAWRFQLFGQLQALLRQVLDAIAALGFWGPVLFVLLYIVCCIALVPGAVLTLGAGAVFGLVKGSILVSIAATLGATAAMLVGRYLARDWVQRKLATHPTFNSIDQAVEREGWKIVFLTRLSPAFPFFLVNYLYGLTRVRLRDYVLATWIGIMPGSTLFVYIGSLASPDSAKNSAAAWTFKGIGLVATVLVTVYLTKIARRALARKLPEENNAAVAPQEQSS